MQHDFEIKRLRGVYHAKMKRAIYLRDRGNKAARHQQYTRARNLWNQAGEVQKQSVAAFQEMERLKKEQVQVQRV